MFRHHLYRSALQRCSLNSRPPATLPILRSLLAVNTIDPSKKPGPFLSRLPGVVRCPKRRGVRQVEPSGGGLRGVNGDGGSNGDGGGLVSSGGCGGGGRSGGGGRGGGGSRPKRRGIRQIEPTGGWFRVVNSDCASSGGGGGLVCVGGLGGAGRGSGRGGGGRRRHLGDNGFAHQAELRRLEGHQGRRGAGVCAEALRPSVDLVRVEVVRAPGKCPLLALALLQKCGVIS